ncbi:MAG: DinB family protein [Nocardioidaceae bacterium]
MSVSLPEPGPSHDVKTLFLVYLDFYREAVAAKVSGLSESDLRSTRLPSGWSPIELVKHLAFMERRWLVWGFLGENVEAPWGDDRNGRWHVEDDESLAGLLAALRDGGARTRGIVEAAELSTPATPGGRFPDGTQPPSLAAILFHVLQEYARHAGHLDIARELLDGRVGE